MCRKVFFFSRLFFLNLGLIFSFINCASALSLDADVFSDPDVQACGISEDTQAKFDTVQETIDEYESQGITVTFSDGIGYDNGADYRDHPKLNKGQGSNINALMSQITRNLHKNGSTIYAVDTQQMLDNPDMVDANGGVVPGRSVDFEVFTTEEGTFVRPRMIDYRGKEPKVTCGVALPVEEITTVGVEALLEWANEFTAGIR